MVRYIQIIDQLAEEIEAGRYQPGSTLPTEKELGKRFKSSVTTIRNSLRELQERGYIYRRQGSGTYVKWQPRRALLNVSNIGVTLNLSPGRTEASFMSQEYFLRQLAGARKVTQEHNANLTMAAYHEDSEHIWDELHHGFGLDGFLDFGFKLVVPTS